MTHKLLSERAFGLTFTVVFLSIGVLGWWVYDTLLIWAFVAATALLAVALAAPWLLLPCNRMWGALSRRLGTLTNFLLLGLFFYVVLLPVGVVMRVFKHDPLQRRRTPGSDSYFTPVTRHANSETFPDMF